MPHRNPINHEHNPQWTNRHMRIQRPNMYNHNPIGTKQLVASASITTKHNKDQRSPFGDYPSYSNQPRNFWYPGYVFPQYYPMSYVYPQIYHYGFAEYPLYQVPLSGPLVYEYPLFNQQSDDMYIGDPLDGLQPL